MNTFARSEAFTFTFWGSTVTNRRVKWRLFALFLPVVLRAKEEGADVWQTNSHQFCKTFSSQICHVTCGGMFHSGWMLELFRFKKIYLVTSSMNLLIDLLIIASCHAWCALKRDKKAIASCNPVLAAYSVLFMQGHYPDTVTFLFRYYGN